MATRRRTKMKKTEIMRVIEVSDDTTICEALSSAAKECKTSSRIFDDKGNFLGLRFECEHINYSFMFDNSDKTRVFIEEIR